MEVVGGEPHSTLEPQWLLGVLRFTEWKSAAVRMLMGLNQKDGPNLVNWDGLTRSFAVVRICLGQ